MVYQGNIDTCLLYSGRPAHYAQVRFKSSMILLTLRHDFQAGQQLLNVTTSGHLDIDHQFKQKDCNSHKNKMGNKNRCSIILPTLNYLIFFILYTLWSKLSKTFNDYCISNNAKLAYLFLM